LKTIKAKITEGQILVSDGAWGTFLQEMGAKSGECTELWNINKANEIRHIASSYICAGSNMIGTNSFGGSRLRLARFGLEHKTYEINKKAAEISREVAGNNNHVLGTIGPTGKFLFMSDISEDELYDVFKEQVAALEQGGADSIIIETMSDLEEAKIAIKAIKENTSCEVICSMTFERSNEGGYFTMMGVTPADMVEQLEGTGVDVIGSNCGGGIDELVEVAKEFSATVKGIPLIIQSNAGLPVYHMEIFLIPGRLRLWQKQYQT